MFDILKSIFSLLFSYGLLLMANGLFATLIGIRTKLEGFSTDMTGVIMAAYFTGLLLGARYSVRIVARVGHIRAFAAFASIMSTTALVHALFVNVPVWLLMRPISGFCMAGMIMVTESWLNERAANKNRGKVLSLYMIINYSAAGTGQLLLPLADPSRFHLFSLASILFSLALIPVLMTRSRSPAPVAPAPTNLGALYKVSPIGLLGVFGAGMINAAFYGMGPVFTRDIGLSLTGTSIFMACGIFGGLVLQWPSGWLSDRVDRRWVMAGATFATGCACVFIVMVTRQQMQFGLYAGAALYGMCAFILYSVSAAHTNDLTNPENRFQTASGLMLVYGVGAIAGPLLASQAMTRLGATGVFMFIGVVAFYLSFYALYRMQKRHTTIGKDKAPYIPVPASQYSSSELYRAARAQRDEDSVSKSTKPEQ